MIKFTPKVMGAAMLFLLCTQSSLAITIQGSSSGIFTDPIGPEDMITSGIGPSSFSWGKEIKFGQSNLTYFGKSFITETEEIFKLGKLKFFNGTILSGTETDSVTFNADVNFDIPNIGNQSFSFNLDLINTINKKSNTKDENADIVLLPSLFANEVFEIDGVTYTLKLMFGQVGFNGFSEIDKFFVHEGKYAKADLLGVITSDFPVPIPVPAALPLFLSALMGICLVGRSSKQAN